jgi:hypothetical protein
MVQYSGSLLSRLAACSAVLVGLFLCAGRPVSAQALPLVIDYSQLANPALSGSNVYVTFYSTETGTLTLDPSGAPEQIVFTSGPGTSVIGGTYAGQTIASGTYSTTRAYSLAEINQKGLEINNVTSLSGYISYGGAQGIQALGVGTQPSNGDLSTSRYSQFELTYNGTPGGGFDLTNITHFGGSLGMAMMAGSGTQSYVRNTLNTGNMFRALAATPILGTSSPAVIQQGGSFVHMIGSNAYITSQGTYPTFNPYLQSLYDASGSASVASLQGPNPSPPGPTYTAVGSTIVSASTTYGLTYYMTSSLNQAAAPGGSFPNGTYGLTVSGSVIATRISGTGIASGTYSNLQLTVGPDTSGGSASALSMTNFMYAQNTSNSVTGSSGWSDLIADFGADVVSAAVQQKALGDFSQGIMAGLVNSGTTPPGATEPFGQMSSNEWFATKTFQGAAYAGAQSNPAFYNAYANVVNRNSEVGIVGTGTYFGGVYGVPYDDRWSNNLLATNASTTSVKVWLLPDGDLSVNPVPEPSAMALLSVAGATLCGLGWRRRRHGCVA